MSSIIRSLAATLAGLGCLTLAFLLSSSAKEWGYARNGREGMDFAMLLLLAAVSLGAGCVVGLIARVTDYFSAAAVLMVLLAIGLLDVAMAMVESGDSVSIRRNTISGTVSVLAYVGAVLSCKFLMARRARRRAIG